MVFGWWEKLNAIQIKLLVLGKFQFQINNLI